MLVTHRAMRRRGQARPLFAVVLLVLLLGLAHPTDRASGPATAHGSHPASCRQRGGLPDPVCTPGASRPDASLSMICRRGYSRSVRPSVSYTEPLKLRQMRAYGLSGRPGEYEEDHLIALSLGGAPSDPANLWPEPRKGRFNAEEKDRLEAWAARMACAGRMPLGSLWREMAVNWTALYRAAGGARGLSSYPPGR
jgi:hypothetical protein